MPSTLQVENIIGPTTGSNADTVLIPSGQELHASGHVVQTVWAPKLVSFDSTVNGYVTQASVTFTPKFTGSRIVIEWSGHVYKYNSTANGNSPARLVYDGTNVWSNPYLTYSGVGTQEYMFTGFARGSTTSTSTSAVTVSFDISAGTQGRQYVYANTGGILITEIAQ